MWNLCTIFSPIISHCGRTLLRCWCFYICVVMLMFLYEQGEQRWAGHERCQQCCSVIVITCQQVETGLFYQYKFLLFQEPCSRTTLLLHHYSTILLKRCWTISCWSANNNVRQCALFRQQPCDNLWYFYVCKSRVSSENGTRFFKTMKTEVIQYISDITAFMITLSLRYHSNYWRHAHVGCLFSPQLSFDFKLPCK